MIGAPATGFLCGTCGQRYDHAGYCPHDGQKLAETDDPLLGTEVGRYRMARVLGEGGMGRVYLAVQPAIGSRVAIKILSDQCARDPALLERFFAEARAVNLVHHENIVSVLDLAQLPDGRPFIVMEYIEGQTLAAIVQASSHTGAVPLGGLVQVMTEVLSALAAAHAIGIVHRDLKPDNILVTAEGHAKVLDFGIAKLAPELQQQLSPRTRTGALLGTPQYMAPEQISGSAGVDPRTDVYAAGVVLYELATGRQPFVGETLFDLMRAHLEQPPQPPRALRPDLPAALEQVILTALAKRPEDRFVGAAAMAQALQYAAQALPPEQWRSLSARAQVSGRVRSRSGPDLAMAYRQTQPVGPSPTIQRRRRRGRIAGAIAVAAIVAAVAFVVLRGGGGPPRVALSDPNAAPSAGSAPAVTPSSAAGTGAPTLPSGPRGPSAAGTGAGSDAAGTGAGSGAAGTGAPILPSGLGGPSAAGTAAGSAAAGTGGPTAPSGPGGSSTAGTAGGSTAAGTSSPTAPSSAPAGSAAPSATAGPAASPSAPAATPPAAPSRTQGKHRRPGAGPGSAQSAAPSAAPSASGPTIVGGGSAADHGVVIGPNVTIGPNVVIGSATPQFPMPATPEQLTRPADYDPRRFDPVAYLPRAQKLARELLPDAQLTSFEFDPVFSDGHVDLTMDGQDRSFEFRSPERSALPAGRPRNLPAERKCRVSVEIGVRAVSARVVTSDACDAHLVRAPHCSFAAVWKHALAKGIPGDLAARIGWLHDETWFFDIDLAGNGGGVSSFADRCP